MVAAALDAETSRLVQRRVIGSRPAPAMPSTWRDCCAPSTTLRQTLWLVSSQHTGTAPSSLDLTVQVRL